MTESQYLNFLEKNGIGQKKLMVMFSMAELFDFVNCVEQYVLNDIIKFEDSSESVPSSFIRAKLKRDEH
jgi:hypothetical protein